MLYKGHYQITTYKKSSFMSCFFAQEVPNGHMPLLAVSYKGVSDKILGVLYSPNTI